VRFVRLSVRHFRGVDAADVQLGPRFNVLFGPNDQGKTTLVRALRAALLLPADSTAHKEYLPWHSHHDPEVALTLEHGGLWIRVTKRFGTGSTAESRLEESPDGQ
jgi:recombinational DNA repair ATPase RecF